MRVLSLIVLSMLCMNIDASGGNKNETQKRDKRAMPWIVSTILGGIVYDVVKESVIGSVLSGSPSDKHIFMVRGGGDNDLYLKCESHVGGLCRGTHYPDEASQFILTGCNKGSYYEAKILGSLSCLDAFDDKIGINECHCRNSGVWSTSLNNRDGEAIYWHGDNKGTSPSRECNWNWRCNKWKFVQTGHLTRRSSGGSVGKWQTCNSGQMCDQGWTCCVAPGDRNNGKTTCRPPNDCI